MQVVFDSCWGANLVNPGSRGVFLAARSHAAFAELFYETHDQRSLLSKVAVSKKRVKVNTDNGLYSKGTMKSYYISLGS